MIELVEHFNSQTPGVYPRSPIWLAESPNSTGTVDDDDEPEDESDDENEAPIRETDDETEAPEEFETDDEDDLEDDVGHPEDDA